MKIWIDRIIWLAPLAVFAFMLTGICPGIHWGDDGLLISSSVSLGIGHPPGHPLYMHLYRLALALPLGDIAFRYNLMSTVFIVLAILCLIALMRHLLKEPLYRFWGPLLSILFIILHVYTWHQAVRAETYALHLFIMLLSLLTIIRLPAGRGLPLGAFIAALLIGNQLFLAALAGPGLLFAWIVKWLKCDSKKRTLIISSFLFLFGLSLYLYPLLRNNSPSIDSWFIMETPSDYISYISASDYRDGFFNSDQAEPKNKLTNYLDLLTNVTKDSGYILPIICVLLLLYQTVSFRRMHLNPAIVSVAIILIVSGAGAASCINFDADNWDFQGYLLPVIVLIPVFVFLALDSFKSKLPIKPETILILMAVAAFLPLNISDAGGYRSLAGRREAAISGRCALDDPEPNSLVLTRSDVKYVLDYLTVVEKYRDDLVILSRNYLLRNITKNNLKFALSPLIAPDLNLETKHSYESYLKQFINLNGTRFIYWELADDDKILDNIPVKIHSWFVELNSTPDKIVSDQLRYAEILGELSGNRYRQITHDTSSVEQLSMLFYNQGTLYLKQGNMSFAVNRLKIATILDSSQPRIYNNLGVALARAGMIQPAREAFIEALKVDPGHSGAKRNLDNLEKPVNYE